MQFKHPEILYALFLLLIPIIVHLFQLRRFEKVPFTNVKFLKQIEIQTRKSSKLKKFLILCTRLLALAALIVAFSQPYTSSAKKEKKNKTYIYLDNSMSMQIKGSQGELLKRAVQDIIKSSSSITDINLVTNNQFFKDLSSEGLKNQLLDVEYHPIAQDLTTTLFKIGNNEKGTKTLNNVIFISDFQDFKNIKLDSLNSYAFIQLKPAKQQNISIDSVYISNQTNENITLKAILKNYGEPAEGISVALFNGSVLQGKSSVSLGENDTKTVDFVINNNGNFNGKLTIDDPNLTFDNELYFSINQEEKINVLAIGDNNQFLSKIYTEDEFNFKSVTSNQIDYSKLNEQNLIVLNELENIPTSLISSLKEFSNNGGSLLLIPNSNSNNASYDSFFKSLGLGTFTNKIENSLAITNINFTHPVLKNVFEKQVTNFQYPSVNSYHKNNLANSTAILSFENESPFISKVSTHNRAVYIVAAAINANNSNFKNSPLIVPVFYNIARQSYKHAQLNYTIGKQNDIEVMLKLEKDDILQLSNDAISFIPLQQIGNSSVKLSLNDRPIKSGFYTLKNKENPIKNLAFNYDREEGVLNTPDVAALLKPYKNATYYTDIENAISTMSAQYKTNNLWQLFLVAAIVFFLIEIGLLKFLKS